MQNVTTCQCYLPKEKRLCKLVPKVGKKYCWRHEGGQCKNKAPVSPKRSPIKTKRSPTKNIPLGELGADVNMLILDQMADPDLLQMCQTSKQYQAICNDERFWQRRLQFKFPQAANPEVAPTSWKQLYLDTSDEKIVYLPLTVTVGLTALGRIGKEDVDYETYRLLHLAYPKRLIQQMDAYIQAGGIALPEAQKKFLQAQLEFDRSTIQQIIERNNQLKPRSYFGLDETKTKFSTMTFISFRAHKRLKELLELKGGNALMFSPLIYITDQPPQHIMEININVYSIYRKDHK